MKREKNSFIACRLPLVLSAALALRYRFMTNMVLWEQFVGWIYDRGVLNLSATWSHSKVENIFRPFLQTICLLSSTIYHPNPNPKSTTQLQEACVNNMTWLPALGQ